MIFIKSSLVIFLVISFATVSVIIETDSFTNGRFQQHQKYLTKEIRYSPRHLQAISTTDKQVAGAISKAITDANTLRTSKGMTSLVASSSLTSIISQWFKALKGSIPLSMYLQLYGMSNLIIETYDSVPSEHVAEIIANLSIGLYEGSSNQVSNFYSAIDANNYKIILAFSGGNNPQTVEFTQQNIQSVIDQINNKNSLPAASTISQSATINLNISSVPSPNNQINTNITSATTSQLTTKTPQSKTSSQLPTQTNNISSFANQSQSVYSISTQNLSVSSSKNLPNDSTTTVPLTSTQSTSLNATTSLVSNSSNLPKNTSTLPSTDNKSSPPLNQTTISLTNTVQITQSTQTIPVNISSGNSQISQTSSSTLQTIQNTLTVQTQSNTSTTKQSVQSQTATTTKTTSSSQQSSQSRTIQLTSSLPLITQTTFTNTTSFAGIVLNHGVPTTFLKNEIFPFKGYITAANPTGVTVSVIFTRISDQQRLAFSQFLPANTNSFEILAWLNMTGIYYLSVFPGSSGLTSITQYTVAPSFIGEIVSRSPTPLSAASLNLIGNDLWVNWTYSDVVQPTLTQVIFTQGGFSVRFLLSNYVSSFKVPYDQFWLFNSGSTSIQITQAFSSNESGNMRTSDFSAPFNIIFNATYHNFATITSSNLFAPIPLKVPQKGSIQLSGPAGVQLQNTILLVTPSKRFQQYYADGNSNNLYISKGFLVNMTINFNETGVYILEVNDAGGQAMINIPIYVGDIYPLVPDFVDLAPKYIDLAALSQPSLIEDRRSLVLDMINNIRSIFGVGRLYLDNKLNSLAQNYSATQIQYNYVGHTDMQGNSPNQRAAAAGILEGVGENLAMNNNLTQAQLMLQRSPAHLQNMVNPNWTRVGLGIAQNANKFYYLTQEFSSRDLTLYPLTSNQIMVIQSGFVNYVIGKYSYIQGEDKGLSSRLSAYQEMTNRPYIITYLQNLGYGNVGVANVVVSYANGNFMNLIKSGNNFEPTSTIFRQVGLTVMYTNGNLEIFAAYI